MSPYTSSMKGLLSVESISAFMIVGAVSMELLTLLNKATTFKSSTKIIIIYDAIYLVAITAGYLYLTDRQFIILIMSMTIPYWPLVRNTGNKYKALLGERYPRYFVEHLSTRISLLETRISLVAMGTAALISTLAPSPKHVVIVFISVSFVQSVWSVYSYRKYYTIFER
jgi:hypothetical protein